MNVKKSGLNEMESLAKLKEKIDDQLSKKTITKSKLQGEDSEETSTDEKDSKVNEKHGKNRQRQLPSTCRQLVLNTENNRLESRH